MKPEAPAMAHQPPSDHTVLKFVHLQFGKNWTRHFPTTVMFYTATANAQLLVVTEGATGRSRRTLSWSRAATMCASPTMASSSTSPRDAQARSRATAPPARVRDRIGADEVEGPKSVGFSVELGHAPAEKRPAGRAGPARQAAPLFVVGTADPDYRRTMLSGRLRLWAWSGVCLTEELERAPREWQVLGPPPIERQMIAIASTSIR